MYQGVQSDDLERYHEAPVYQTRRDIARLRRDLAPNLLSLLQQGRSQEWETIEIQEPQNFQFFRRVWDGRGASFYWTTYVVEQFTVARVKAVVDFISKGKEYGRPPIELLGLYFANEPRGSHIHQSLDILAEIKNKDIDDDLAALFHHELLNLYSRIAARGSILHHIWEDYTTSSSNHNTPAGYLVQVVPNSTPGSFPSFYSWDIIDGLHPQLQPRSKRHQEAIHIRSGSQMSTTDANALARFFQEYLYPLFAYPGIALPTQNPTAEGHAQEGIFGFLFAPFYPLRALSNGTAGPLIRKHFGDWLGILQMELRTEEKNLEHLRKTPVFRPDITVEFLRAVHSSLDDRVSRLVESSAIRWAESQNRMDDPDELCAKSIAKSLGWDVSLATTDLDGPVELQHDGSSGSAASFLLQLDWEWPRRRPVQKRSVLLVSLIPTLFKDGQSPKLPSNEDEWQEVLPQAYELCRGIHRTVFTWWHAQRSRRIDVSGQLMSVLERTTEWFGQNNRLPNLLPHSLPSLTKEVVDQHLALVRNVLPCLPEAWWCPDSEATEDAVWGLHENLKSTFGPHACVNGGTKQLTVGGALIILMLILHAEFPSSPPYIDLGSTGFGRFRNLSYLLPIQVKGDAQASYEAVAALFRDVVKLKRTATPAIKKVTVDRNGKYFDILLDWAPEDQKKFFKKFTGVKREYLPPADTLDNTVNATWTLLIAGSSGTDTIGRSGLVAFSMRKDGLRLRIG